MNNTITNTTPEPLTDEIIAEMHPMDLVDISVELFKQHNSAKGAQRAKLRSEYNRVAYSANNKLGRQALIILS